MRKWVTIAALLFPHVLAAQALRTGAQLATFRSTVDGSVQPYALYVPKSFDASRKYPLVICLHSEESTHRLMLRQTFATPSRFGEADPEDMRYFPSLPEVDFLVACPYARGTMGYRGIPERDVYDVLADVERRFPIDAARVYLTGISMGGGGALRFALTRPDVWAAVAPVCAAVDPALDELAGNALNIPVRLYHGESDPLVPVQSSRAWQRRLLDSGVSADYLEFPGIRHNAWDPAYRDLAVFKWFAQFRRNAMPERVHFVTRSYRYSAAYWVRIDGLTPGTLTTIDARRAAPNHVQVETQNVDGFTLALDRAPAVVTIDGSDLRLKPGAATSFTKASGRWAVGKLHVVGKGPGAEGPIVEAVSSRHIYVYGSLGAVTAEQLEGRRKEAETAASWTAHTRLSLVLPVKVDSEVTAEEIAGCDLVLFGTVETNSLIARFAGALPLALSPGAADYGLLFIAPVGSHYVLVSSGLPWWNGADEARRGGDPFAPAQFRILSTMGDYLLFKGSLANVVAEGRFDRNWKVPADAAAKMAATGTVAVR